MAFWRERRVGRCKAPRRRRCGDIVEEWQRRRCPPAAAPRRVAALECVGCAEICPCAARAKHNVIVPPGPQQNAKLFLREPYAPVSDPGFVRRIQASLRKGGKVVFEHFVRDADHPYPEVVRALEPGQLRNYFGSFQIERYEELDGIGDWGGPGSRLVRMVARKQ